MSLGLVAVIDRTKGWDDEPDPTELSSCLPSVGTFWKRKPGQSARRGRRVRFCGRRTVAWL